MTGYSVSSRIRRVEVGSPRGQHPLDRGSPEPPVGDPSADVSLEELAGAFSGSRLRDLCDDFVTTWRQTTFYLFDPQSWR
jgi:hypothetical protein